jgi:small subunit ribosomal protein S17
VKNTGSKGPKLTPAKVSTAVKKIATRTGLVESDLRSQSRRVAVEVLSTHAKYGKIMRGRTILHVHDEANASKLGDLVEVQACRPISKTKRWKLVRVVQSGVGLQFTGVDAPKTGADEAGKPATKPVTKAPATGAKPAVKTAAKTAPAKK